MARCIVHDRRPGERQWSTSFLTNDGGHQLYVKLTPCADRDVVQSDFLPPDQHTGIHHRFECSCTMIYDKGSILLRTILRCARLWMSFISSRGRGPTRTPNFPWFFFKRNHEHCLIQGWSRDIYLLQWLLNCVIHKFWVKSWWNSIRIFQLRCELKYVVCQLNRSHHISMRESYMRWDSQSWVFI